MAHKSIQNNYWKQQYFVYPVQMPKKKNNHLEINTYLPVFYIVFYVLKHKFKRCVGVLSVINVTNRKSIFCVEEDSSKNSLESRWKGTSFLACFSVQILSSNYQYHYENNNHNQKNKKCVSSFMFPVHETFHIFHSCNLEDKISAFVFHNSKPRS